MIEPLLHRIVVKPENFEELSEDHKYAKKIGLEIVKVDETRNAQASVDVGVVVAIGPTAYKDFGVSSPVSVGDRVNYARFSGKIVKDPATKEEFVVLNDEDCICIIKE